MYLIVGLGNPEPEYANTRHNMGFCVINKLAEIGRIEVRKSKFDGLYGSGELFGEKVVLLKPQTYMNDSGRSIIQAKQFFKVENNQIIIIYDDLDIEVGSIRVRPKGHANTHNGMKSVVAHLGTIDFPRVRVGIGKPDKDLIDYVIEKLPIKKREELEIGIDKAILAVEEILKNGIDKAMTTYNTKENSK